MSNNKDKVTLSKSPYPRPENYPGFVQNLARIRRYLAKQPGLIKEQERRMFAVAEQHSSSGGSQLAQQVLDVYDNRAVFEAMQEAHDALHLELPDRLQGLTGGIILARCLDDPNIERAGWNGTHYANRQPDEQPANIAIGHFLRTSDPNGIGHTLIIEGLAPMHEGMVFTVPVLHPETRQPNVLLQKVPVHHPLALPSQVLEELHVPDVAQIIPVLEQVPQRVAQEVAR